MRRKPIQRAKRRRQTRLAQALLAEAATPARGDRYGARKRRSPTDRIVESRRADRLRPLNRTED
jgi:hypothetical protein